MRYALAVAVCWSGCSREAKAPPPPALLEVKAPPPPAAAVAPDGGPPVDPVLRPVPKDVAAQVALQEVATGFARPVLLVAAPGDREDRLFVVEQHAGRVRR